MAGLGWRQRQAGVVIEIPHQQLSPEALQSVLEEFASRDGTEFTPLDVKVAQLRGQLLKGELKIVFDAPSETCQVVLARDVRDT